MLHINVQQQLGRLTLRADLQLPTQGVTAIFGLSGSGKTSLINLVSGLTHPDQGFIRLNDRTLVEWRTVRISLCINAKLVMYSKMLVYFRITMSKVICVMA